MSAYDKPLRLKIGERWVGDGEPSFIIAEAGSNHNRDFDQALRLIDIAVRAGADAIKFQHFRAATLYPRSAGQSDYLRTDKSIYDIIREMEMPDDWVPRLAEACRAHNIAFLVSPFDEAAVDRVDPFVPAFKVASYEMTHIPLLQHVARKGKPMIVSTGTASLHEVLHSVECIRREGNTQIVLLQCTASYPTPLDAVNVRALVTLREATGVLTGLSDHSRDPIVAPIVAVTLGACVLEKHFTTSNLMPGPDHKYAVEPNELKELVQRVRQAEQAIGHGRKVTLPIEEELRAFARRSIFTTQSVQKGEKLTSHNIAVLRCGKRGYGLPPEDYGALLGRRAARDISAETLISQGDLE